ncbi:MAG: LicD family protein [Bacteroides sp.]|nr:LicD family protein [Roseburia sp.]MCM1347621.1 LicD family protein [Bacteroides sp.]MCM1422071.1 LicD family protein [Bacteroides sp.]
MAKLQTSRGVFHYTPKTLYLGIKQIDRTVAFDNLKVLMPLLHKKGITAGPFLGTLLGIVRENDFIEWDEDIDLFILKEQEDLLRNALWDLQEAGFELVRYERRGLYSVMRNGEYIDFYVMYRIGDNLRYSGGADFMFENYMTDTITWDFKGIPIEVPREYDDFLTFHYGDWRTPVKYADFNQSKLKICLVKLEFFIKNHLPDFLYFPLLKKYHMKHLEKFKIKCEKKGRKLPDNITL